MAKFRNITGDTLTVGSTSGVVVEPDKTFDVADELVLEEGHSCTDDCTHPAEARVYPATLFKPAGGTTKAEPDIAPPSDAPTA